MTTEAIPKRASYQYGQDTSWWVCTNWIETPEKPAEFVYGIAARCRRPVQGVRSKLLVASAPWSVVQHEAILSGQQFESLIVNAAQGTIKFGTSIAGDTRQLHVVVTESYIGDCLGHTAAKITSYASCATPPTLADDRDRWTLVINALESDLGIAFRDKDAYRIGCFDVATLQPWLEDPPPVLIEAIMPDIETRQTAGVRQIQICRSDAFSKMRQFAHVVCFRDNNRRLIDRLVVLAPGQHRSELIESSHPVERFEFSLFSEAGDLLHRDESIFFGGFQLTMGVQGRRLQIDDELTRKANAQKKKDAFPYGQVTSVTHQRTSTMFAPVSEQWMRHQSRMSEVCRLCFPSKSKDKWFSRSLDEEIGVLAHFDKLLGGGNICGAVLVDPFFGEDALRRFVLRLSSTDVKVTVITSWTSTDPDTGVRLGNPTLALRKLEALLQNTRQIINPSLKVINLEKQSEQAFHDRYLLLYPREGDPQVYLLSNSVNGMAANWPFCMSLLADDVRQQAQAYIEGLCRGADITAGVNPTISFMWPSGE